MSSSSDYLRRLRAEQEIRRRREQLVGQQAERLRQQREVERERQLRQEAVQKQLYEQWLASRRSEQQQVAAEKERRRAASAKLLDTRRNDRQQQQQRVQQQEQSRTARLREQRRKSLEARQAGASAIPPSEPPQQPVNPRLEVLRAARAEELRTQRQAEKRRQENLARLREQPVNPRLEALRAARAEELRMQRQAEKRQENLARFREKPRELRQFGQAGARKQDQLRAAGREEVRQQKTAASAADERLQTLRQKELGRRAALLPSPALQPKPRVAPSKARATESRPSSLPLPPIQEEVALSWLNTQNGFLVDENGSPVYLRGVTVEGFDTISPKLNQSVSDAMALDDANISVLAGVWGVNLIRIPFSSRAILAGNASLSQYDLMAGLDDLVATVSSAGCYVLLALKPALDNTLPSDDDYLCWRALAIRCRDQPAVLYELFAATSVLPANWLGVAQALIGTVRREHTASLLFFGNGSATADVRGFPMKFTTGDPIQNMVYTIRLTPELLNTVDRPPLQALAQAYPVFVSHWSDGGPDFGRSSELAADLVERCGMGWAAANWNAGPRLVTNAAAHEFVPTRWGLLVQRALAQPLRPLLTPYGMT